jgi:hypothetical protein
MSKDFQELWLRDTTTFIEINASVSPLSEAHTGNWIMYSSDIAINEALLVPFTYYYIVINDTLSTAKVM